MGKGKRDKLHIKGHAYVNEHGSFAHPANDLSTLNHGGIRLTERGKQVVKGWVGWFEPNPGPDMNCSWTALCKDGCSGCVSLLWKYG